MSTTLAPTRATPARTRTPRAKAAATGGTPIDAAPVRRSLLRPLGIVGYDAHEPAILAALATEEPLLLVSDHGAAKTLLLVRLAGALGLTLRHYNASLLQFDDLAGFPIPADDGTIRYAAPPGAIWDAEVAFFDEIGRCRPEVANKLFPIIHERRIQGMPISRLRYRWAATNPPADAQPDAAHFAYEAVEALDPALADRFSYIVRLPAFDELGDTDRRAIIAGTGALVNTSAHQSVCELVRTTQLLMDGVRATSGDALATYVDVLVAKLRLAKIIVGGRRAATLHRNLVAIRAAHLALGLPGDDRACRAAVLASITDVVRRCIPRLTLLGAHEAAWKQVSLDDDAPERLLLAVHDPVQRTLLALTLPALTQRQRGEAVCTALAELDTVRRHAVAWFILPHLSDSALVPLTTVETVAGLVAGIAFDGATVNGYAPHRAWAVGVRSALARSALPQCDADYLHGVLITHGLAPAQGGADPYPDPQQLLDPLLALRTACLTALGVAPAPAAP